MGPPVPIPPGSHCLPPFSVWESQYIHALQSLQGQPPATHNQPPNHHQQLDFCFDL